MKKPRRKVRSTPAKRTTRPAPRPALAKQQPPRRRPVSTVANPALDRARRRLSQQERGLGSEADSRLLASVVSGGEDLRHTLEQHTGSSPVLTAGDVDARWDDAYSVGDEAPGGDNPTPDQDRVDDIGKALGVNYETNEELKGAGKIEERDRHRWELDPASSDDWPHDKG